ncbi:MAG: sulfotransferase [Candidatus Methanosuratincola sp.]
MYETIERMWISFTNSEEFRSFSKRGFGSVLFRSPAYRRLLLGKNYLTSYYTTLRYPALFSEVENFCIFIGHNKSGTSMIGSLLDAHPNIILADEVGALEHISAGFSRDQIFHILLRMSRKEFLKGKVTARRLTPYSYLVPGQWQGRCTTLKVIGDGTASSSTRRFAQEPDLLQRLQDRMAPVGVKFIQMIRNPYDVISVMMVRGKRSFENALGQYFANCVTLTDLRKKLDDSSLFAMRYEHFIEEPEQKLRGLCRYLRVECPDDYLNACLSILHPSPHQNRDMVKWQASWIDAVQDKIEQYDFLQGYSFEI